MKTRIVQVKNERALNRRTWFIEGIAGTGVTG
jgi:hypothetical protein